MDPHSSHTTHHKQTQDLLTNNNTASNHLPHPVKKLSMEKVLVLIVGAGPSGLAAATCLSEHGIPYRIVEREDCSASLWRKRTYDRLKLHLAKEFCELPHMSCPSDTPKYITKEQFA